MTLRKMPEIRAFQQTTEAITWEPPAQAIEAFHGEVRAANDEAPDTISIYGMIGVDPFSDVDNSERRITAALRKIGSRNVVVNVNSLGGNFFSGLAIYNLLRAHPAKVTVNVIAMAGSAASIIAMAGDEILMAEGSFLMVHNASGVIVGNKFDAQDAASLLGEIDEAMGEIYAARAGVEKAEALSWMNRRRGDGTMFNASTAIERGLADGKLGRDAVRVSADAAKEIPAERVVERALMASNKMTSVQAKTMVATLKSGTRDAAEPATRDAGEFNVDQAQALARLIETIRPAAA